MVEVISFVRSHKYFIFLLTVVDLLFIRLLTTRICILLNGHLYEAAGKRNSRVLFYNRWMSCAAEILKEYDHKRRSSGFYRKARDKIKKAGYKSDYAPMVYLVLKYVIPVLLFFLVFTLQYPEIRRPFILAVSSSIIVDLVVFSRKRGRSLKFQRHVYKIYKYLHNQISSGIKVTEAVKSVYQIIDDKEIRDSLIKLAANYELTLDIDKSLEEFKTDFYSLETETLCIALRQGILTGDNQELLERQEQVMFNKYFNYIQAETDGCKMRSLAAAAVFTIIIIAMIAVPLFNDASEAVSRIFIN